MTSTPPIVLSASRRTDIPAFYMPWFMENIDRGYFEVENPFNRRPYRVAAHPEQVHSIVFWSKDYSPFLAAEFDRRLEQRGYHLFFHFTLNSQQPLLEPGVPPLEARLNQLRRLCHRHDPRAVTWRFDPICHLLDAVDPAGHIETNLADFTTIAREAAALGIERCVTSFFDDYAKVRRRTRRQGSIRFWQPPLKEKIAILEHLQGVLQPLGMTLSTCSEKELLAALPATSPIQKSACIPHDILVDLFGGALPGTPDLGQRRQRGCGCHTSRDIGAYRQQPCRHNCLYCYASPAGEPDNAQ
ncbi:MAG: DUF1848 domain-containing protein [Desulfobacterales bacterium]